MKNETVREARRPGGLRRPARSAAGVIAATRRRLSAQGGFTLIELLIATTLSIVVIGAPLTFIIFSINQQNGASSRAVAARQGEVGLERLVRDLRSAILQTAVNGTPLTVSLSSSGTPKVTQFSFSIPTPNADTTAQAVVWRCTDGGTCTRRLGAAAAVSEITGVTSTSLYDASGTALSLPTTNPAYLGITLNLRVTSQLGGQTQTASGASNPIIVQTGVDLRNFA